MNTRCALICSRGAFFGRNQCYACLIQRLIFHSRQSWHSVNNDLPVVKNLTRLHETDPRKARVNNWLMSQWVFNCLVCVCVCVCCCFSSSVELCVCVLGWACYHPWQIKRFKWCVLIKPEQGLRSVPASPRCVCIRVDMWGKQGQMDCKLRLPHRREHTHTHTHTHLCQLFFNRLHKQSGVVPLKCSYGLKAAAAAHPPLRQAKLVQPDLLHQTPPAALHTLLKCTDFYTAPSTETLLCWHVSKELDVPALDNTRLKTRLRN